MNYTSVFDTFHDNYTSNDRLERQGNKLARATFSYIMFLHVVKTQAGDCGVSIQNGARLYVFIGPEILQQCDRVCSMYMTMGLYQYDLSR